MLSVAAIATRKHAKSMAQDIVCTKSNRVLSGKNLGDYVSSYADQSSNFRSLEPCAIRIWCMKGHIPTESGERWAGLGLLGQVPVGNSKS